MILTPGNSYFRDSKIARLLKDSVGNLTCRTTIINHVSPDEDRYSETLSTLEMASKISRSRRRKNKVHTSKSNRLIEFVLFSTVYQFKWIC